MAEFIPNSLNMAFLDWEISFCGKHVSYTSLEANDIETKLIRPFSASGINFLTCSGVPAKATDTLGLLTSQYSLSLRRQTD